MSHRPPVRLIAVGSTNPAKVSAVIAVARRVWPDACVRGIDVPSGVSEMPMSDEELRRGALERAKRARAALDADLGLGLEGGVARHGDLYFVCGWVATVDRGGHVGLGATGRVLLPDDIARRLREGDSLGEIMDELSGQTDSRTGPGAIGILTAGLVTRAEAFQQAVAFSLAPFLRPEWYRAVTAETLLPSAPRHDAGDAETPHPERHHPCGNGCSSLSR